MKINNILIKSLTENHVGKLKKLWKKIMYYKLAYLIRNGVFIIHLLQYEKKNLYIHKKCMYQNLLVDKK